jgi:hypothetical protein
MSQPASALGVAEVYASLRPKFPPELELHLVLDNYGTHQEPQVQAWLKLANVLAGMVPQHDRGALRLSPGCHPRNPANC